MARVITFAALPLAFYLGATVALLVPLTSPAFGLLAIGAELLYGAGIGR